MIEIIEHKYNPTTKLIRRKKTTEIILHCSATCEGKDYSVEDIDRWHKNKDYACIGYHYVIYRDGSIHRGRSEAYSGAHTLNHNPVSIGICYIGGVDAEGNTKDTRTDAQREAMYRLVQYVMEKYGVPLTRVYGHREFAAKGCPSFKTEQFRREYEEWSAHNK